MSAPTGITPGSQSHDQPSPATAPGAAPAIDPPGDGTQPGSGSIAARPVIAVTELVTHPGNVRRDLDLSPEFVASIAANGVLVPLRITPDPDGRYRVIDGHRRLAAAVKTGLAEVPADLAGDREGDEPGQYLDMWTAHRHRSPLTQFEEADALFAAHEAGATKARIHRSSRPRQRRHRRGRRFQHPGQPPRRHQRQPGTDRGLSPPGSWGRQHPRWRPQPARPHRRGSGRAAFPRPTNVH
jgi:hypothetical protein